MHVRDLSRLHGSAEALCTGESAQVVALIR